MLDGKPSWAEKQCLKAEACEIAEKSISGSIMTLLSGVNNVRKLHKIYKGPNRSQTQGDRTTVKMS